MFGKSFHKLKNSKVMMKGWGGMPGVQNTEGMGMPEMLLFP